MSSDTGAGSLGKRGRPQTRLPRKKVKTTGQGIALRGQSRELVCAVREYFEQERDNGGPLITINKVIERTAAALKINKSTVVTISKEKCELQEKEEGDEIVAGPSTLVTPGKKRSRPRTVTKWDTFQEDAIRRHVYAYYQRKEHPTLNKLLVSLKHADLFSGSRSSLRNLLQEIGFHYKALSGRQILLEREDVTAWRCRFLSQIMKENIDEIVWLDETWVNAGHSVKKGWVDDTPKGTMAAPLGRGGRLIMVHAGTSAGFVPNGLLLFRSKKTGDYHEEMDSNKFIKWFTEQLLPNIRPQSTIVMDNASYHSVQLDKAPTMATRKSEILDWLRSHDLPADETKNKAELLEVVSANKPRFPVYLVDEVARERGYKVIRLPPYHCHFNPIEMIWAQVKGHVARNNQKFTVSEVQRLTLEAIDNITPTHWENVVRHTQRVMKEAWRNEGLLEIAVEELIINLSGSSSSSDSDSDSDISGVAPLSPKLQSESGMCQETQ